MIVFLGQRYTPARKIGERPTAMRYSVYSIQYTVLPRSPVYSVQYNTVYSRDTNMMGNYHDFFRLYLVEDNVSVARYISVWVDGESSHCGSLKFDGFDTNSSIFRFALLCFALPEYCTTNYSTVPCIQEFRAYSTESTLVPVVPSPPVPGISNPTPACVELRLSVKCIHAFECYD